MANYFNTLNLRQQLAHWANAALWRATNSPMAQATFRVKSGHRRLRRAGSEPGLNMRDSGTDISYALRKEAIAEKRASRRKATENGFKVGTYEELIPQADWWLT